MEAAKQKRGMEETEKKEEIAKDQKKEMKYAAEAIEKDQTALVCQEGILGCKGQNRKAGKKRK